MKKYTDFYDTQDRENTYSAVVSPGAHKFTNVLESIKDKYRLDQMVLKSIITRPYQNSFQCELVN